MFKKLILREQINPTIETYQGTALYYGTEIEDEYGRFDDSYSTNQGYFLIHEGKYHHIYKVPFKPKNKDDIIGRLR